MDYESSNCRAGTLLSMPCRTPRSISSVILLKLLTRGATRLKFPSSNWRKKISVQTASVSNFTCTASQRSFIAYTTSKEDKLLVRKPSGHGLGFLKGALQLADWQRRTGRKWKEDLPPWIFEAWHYILSRELNFRISAAALVKATGSYGGTNFNTSSHGTARPFQG